MLKFLQNFFSNIWEQILSKTNVTPVVPLPPKSTSKIESLAQLLFAVNSPYESMYPPVVGKIINAQIHKIDLPTARKTAKLIIEQSEKQNLDYVYLTACIYQESKGDAECFNHNLAEYNGVVSFEGTDWGISQLSGYYLPNRPGVPAYPVKPHEPIEPLHATPEQLTQYQNDMTAYKTAMDNYQHAVYHWENEASQLARTAEWAVPTMAQIMHDNILQATTDVPSVSGIMEKLNTTGLSHIEFLATLYYNRGATGGLKAVQTLNYSSMQHPFMVARWYTQFKAALETGIHPPAHIMVNHEPFGPHQKR